MKFGPGLNVISLSTLLVTAAAWGGATNVYYDKAKVTDVTPMYETVEVSDPEEHCWNERVTHRRPGSGRSRTPTIAGAIVGGVVGNQFGHGRGKDVMTVAGALLGGSIGRDVTADSQSRSYTTMERRCEVVDKVSYREQLTGYKVRYLYKGRAFTTYTDHHPGKHIRVGVTVDPVGKRGGYFDKHYLDE